MTVQPQPKNLDHSLERTDVASSVRVYLIGGVALVLLLGGYWYFNQGGAKAPVRRPAIPVQVSAVTRGDMAVVEHTLGTVVPNTTVQIASRVSGVIDSAPFKEGQYVKKGDLLFVIDPRPYEASYKNAMATLASTKAKAERYRKLMDQNAISPQDLDDAQAAYLQAEASVDTARLNLEFTRIRSPVDGKTGPMLVQPGNTVIANLTTTPLVTIDQIHPVKVSFALPQTDLPRIQARQKSKGLTAIVGFQDQSGSPLSAPVDFISNAVNNVSGTIEMRTVFANTDDTLVPGQLVNVTVQLNDIPNALTVPDAAVNIGPDGNFVYVLNDGKAVTKPVSVLFDDGNNTAITGDLEPGDLVVTEGQLRLVPGSKVVVEGAVKRPVKGGKGKGKGKRAAGKEG